MTGPLKDVTVLDLTQHIVGPYATKLLADFGADVIKVESPTGDPARRLGPFKDGIRGPERSGTFFCFNTNKRSVVLDLQTAAGQEAFWRIAERADLVVESFRPGVLEAMGIGWDQIHARLPRLPLVSVSNFGHLSPYRDYKGSELVLYGFGGEMYSTGRLHREPVKMYGTSALVQSGSALVTALMGALFVGRSQGLGQHVDFSIVDSHLVGVDRRHATVIGVQYSGRKTLRPPASPPPGMLAGLYACADGWIEIAGGGARFRNVHDFLGEQDWMKDPKWDNPAIQTDPAAIQEFNSHFASWLMQRTKQEIWTAGRRAKFLCGPLFTIADVFADANFQERGLWQEAQTPEMGNFRFPGRPFIMNRTPWALRRLAPRLGEHTSEVLAEVPTAGQPTRANDAKASGPARAPLEGVRVLDLTGVWAGTFATLLLADLGAEVLKQENQFVLQPNTRSLPVAHLTKAMTQQGPGWLTGLPDNDPGERPWNYHPMFVCLYRNKRSFTLDIRKPEGLAILGHLVAMSDVVLENSAVGTMEKLGISYDWLRSFRQDIIFMRAPGYGLSGAYRDARTMGSHLEGVMGHQLLRGYRNAEPSENSGIFAADYIAGTQIAFAVMAAIWHRNNTGEGQFIEMAQAENAAAMFAQAYMDHALNGEEGAAMGNRSIYAADGEAPCGAYPCRSPGPASEGLDRWIAITVTCDEEWLALRKVMGNPPWAMTASLETAAGRAAQQDLLDEQLALWTRQFDDYELFHRLQAVGVPAAPVLEASRILEDPHVRMRGLYQPQTLQDDIGEFSYPVPLYEMPLTPIGIRRPPVAFGQDNEYVYKDLLKVTDETWQRLVEGGHIASRFADEVP